MLNFIYIAIGGALGAVSRYSLSLAAHGVFGRNFPYGTLSVNIMGCFLAGVFAILLFDRGGLTLEWRSFLLVGFLGGLTTFSAFSLETVALIQEGRYGVMAANITLNVVACLLAVIIGMKLARLL